MDRKIRSRTFYDSQSTEIGNDNAVSTKILKCPRVVFKFKNLPVSKNGVNCNVQFLFRRMNTQGCFRKPLHGEACVLCPELKYRPPQIYCVGAKAKGGVQSLKIACRGE